MISWERSFPSKQHIKAAVALITAALMLTASFWFDQIHWQMHQALKLSIERHLPLSEGTAATPEVYRRLWHFRYAQGWYTAIGEGEVSVFLYAVL